MDNDGFIPSICHLRPRTGQRWLIACLSLCVASAVQARVELIALGRLDAHGGDKAVRTAAKLENGAPGNLRGGLGSALAYVGCDRFLAMPDRGPNAMHYKPSVSDTTSYITRFHTLQLRLTPSGSDASLPYALEPRLLDTTLLWSPTALVYGDGRHSGLASGVPALNRRGMYYFTGRSDNFAAGRASDDAANGRLDPEGLRMSSDAGRLFVGDEYGPSVRVFDRATGRQQRSYVLPRDLAVARPDGNGQREADANTRGRVSNHGIEGIAVTPDDRTLFAVMQGALLQDGGRQGGHARILRIDLASGAVRQFAYPLQNLGTTEHPRYANVSDAVAINDHALLVIERDGKGLGDGSVASFKQLYVVELAGAMAIGDRHGEEALADVAVTKQHFLDLVAQLTAHGVPAQDIPAKIEGLAFGPDIDVDGRRSHTLFVSSDNDFLADVKDEWHPDGMANPNRFFVFAFDGGDLPQYVPQPVPARCVPR
ncbi:MAG: esterase-like activity of phytase family protein [Xanthomonadales bacterium]|nr:esterase-like activity of phytase family protein [Xanthomonadales bacterium]